jgi:hypothetical protein
VEGVFCEVGLPLYGVLGKWDEKVIDTDNGEVVEGGGLRMTPEAFGRRFGSSKATAQLNLVYPPGKPIGRLQRL